MESLELSLDEAVLIVKFHAVDHDPKAQEFKRWVLANHYKYSKTEILATILTNYADKKNDESFMSMLDNMGITITDDPNNPAKKTIALEGESYVFADLSMGFDEDLLVSGKCHQCCYDAAVRYNEGGECYVCTGQVSAINNKTNYSLSKLLHSYLEINGNAFDLSSKIVLPLEDYNKLFNVDLYSRIPAELIKKDVKDKKLDILVSVNYPLVTYLLARTETLEDASMLANIANKSKK